MRWKLFGFAKPPSLKAHFQSITHEQTPFEIDKSRFGTLIIKMHVKFGRKIFRKFLVKTLGRALQTIAIDYESGDSGCCTDPSYNNISVKGFFRSYRS